MAAITARLAEALGIMLSTTKRTHLYTLRTHLQQYADDVSELNMIMAQARTDGIVL